MGKDYYHINKETAFATDPSIAAPGEWAEMLSESFQPTNQTDPAQGAFHETPDDEGLGRYMWAGGAQFQLGPNNGIGHVLSSLFGPEDVGFPIVVGGETIVYDHQWSSPGGLGYKTLGHALLLSRSNQLDQWNYLGGGATRLNVEAAIDQNLRYSPEFVGDQDEIDATKETPPSPLYAGEYFLHHDSQWKIAKAPDAAVLDQDVEAWSLSIEAATEVVPDHSSRFGRRLYNGGFNFTGRVDRDFVDSLYYKKIYGTDTAVSPQDTITAQNVEIDILGESVGVATNYQLTFLMPKVKFYTIEANVSGQDRITSGSPFQVLRDKTATHAMRVSLRNLQAVTYGA